MYRRGAKGWMKHWDFILLDLFCLQMSFVFAYWLRFKTYNAYALDPYQKFALLITIMDLLIILFTEVYKNVLKRTAYREGVLLIKQTIMLTVLSVFYLFSTKESGQYSRMVIYLFCVIYFCSSYATRIIWKRIVRKKLASSHNRALLIVAVSENIESILHNLRKYRETYGAFAITGIILLDKDRTGEEIDGIPIVAGADNMMEYTCREWIDEVFVDVPRDMRYPEQMLEQFREMGIVTHVKLMEYNEEYGDRQIVEKIGIYTVLTKSDNYASNRALLAKRLLDIVGGLVGCLITGILYLIIGPMIKKESPGPVFFAQERVGRNGRKFKIYKFRSMYLDAEERKKDLMAQNDVKDGMMFKMEWDPRIIGAKILPDGTKKRGIGNIIRDYSLDEFPQFFNVLKGDMSLVGTRPPTVDEWEKYQLHHRARMATKPGITGMWQVSGRSNITDFEEVVNLDKEYIQNWNLGLDIKILFKTVKIVFMKEGAR